MPHSHGYRVKTRRLFTSKRKSRGLTRLLQDYKMNDKVVIMVDPSQVKGMPHRRFHGRVGVIEQVGRRSLVIRVPVGGKEKKVMARLEHVKPHQEIGKDA